MEIILASGSSRRETLLKEVLKNFKIVPSHVEEDFDPKRPHEKVAMDLAMLKASEVAKSHPEDFIVAMDTLVYCDNEILNKPVDHDDAVRMLKMLSNNTQEVVTGVVFIYKDHVHSFYAKSIVKFKELPDEFIESYIATGEPFDKSGAYGIQSFNDYYVESIEGSLSNIMGFPQEMFIRKFRYHAEKWNLKYYLTIDL